MKKIIASNQIPNGSLLHFDPIIWNYIDCYTICKTTSANIDKITTEAFRSPQWTKKLIQLRNFLVKYFGLKTEAKLNNEAKHYPIGSRAMAFTVCARNSNEIVVSEDDKHLFFKVSIFNNKETSQIHVTTVVKFHNTFGKVYFTFVKPFHRLIVKSLAKNLINTI